jgi:hypothetical protein
MNSVPNHDCKEVVRQVFLDLSRGTYSSVHEIPILRDWIRQLGPYLPAKNRSPSVPQCERSA